MSHDKVGEKEPRSLTKVHESGDEARIRLLSPQMLH